jgi:dTMP kinase
MTSFIVICGLDGCGKSTQAKLLAKWLKGKEKEVSLTKEPTDSPIGNLIRLVLKHELRLSPLALQLLFAADRANHLEREIEPAIKEGKVVISDRYMLSSLAYGSLEVELDFLKKVNSGFRRPDLTLLIDTTPHICLERMKESKTHLELFEDEEKLKRVRRNYLALSKYFPNTFMIRGDQRKEEVFQRIREIVEKTIF